MGETPPSATSPGPGWYVDPWREAVFRYWDGSRWTGYLSPPSPPSEPLALPPMADSGRERAVGPAAPVEPARRRRLAAELLIVLAVFPLPYALSALVVLVGSALGRGPGRRTPILIPGHPAASFPLELCEILLPFAAVALVAYLLSSGTSGSEGDRGLSSLGLDRSRPRGDLALVLGVFVACELIPIYGGTIVLSLLGVHGISPATKGVPSYYVSLDVVNGVTSGIVEEIVVLGYLVRRLEQLALPGWAVVVLAVAVRGSYHLYYGWGVLPILAWATASVLVYRRYRRLLPFILVHVLWDSSLFAASALPRHDAAVFLVTEAAILLPVFFVLFLLWRGWIPLPIRHGGGA